MDFFEWLIYHSPDSLIPIENRWYLGDVDDFQVVLAFENWEIRIYSYRRDSDDDQDQEDWWWFCWDVFESFSGCYHQDSIGYVKVDFYNLADATELIINSCKEQLEYISDYTIEDVCKHLKTREPKIKKAIKVYNYYK